MVMAANVQGGVYSAEEHLRNELEWLDAGLRTLLEVSDSESFSDPMAAFKGLVESKEELSTDDSSHSRKLTIVWQAYKEFRRETEKRNDERSELIRSLPLVQLATVLRLTLWEYRCIVLCAAVEVDRNYEKWYAYLNDDATVRTATVDLALRLLGDTEEDWELGRLLLSRQGKLRRWLLQKSEVDAALGLKSPLRLDERVVSFLLETERVDGRLSGVVEALEKEDCPVLALDGQDTLEKKIEQVVKGWPSGSMPVIALWGARGVGKRTLLHRLAAFRGQRLLIVSLSALPAEEEKLRSMLEHLFREALLTDAAVVMLETDGSWKDKLSQEVLRSAFQVYENDAKQPLLGWISIDRRPDYELPLPVNAAIWSLEVPPPTTAERVALWLSHANELSMDRSIPVTPDYEVLSNELANRFQFTPGQIASAWRQALIFAAERGERSPNQSDLAMAARRQFRHRLDQHAVDVKQRSSWKDLILPKESLNLIEEACNRYKLREMVLSDWGFANRVSYGTGVHFLFAGPPGTGKTMAADVVAGELGLALYRVDLSRIVSKYIGETEQRLRELFEEAQLSGAILFFDEGDALFGKRTEVKDSNDRYANMEVAYLLQLIEAYDGVTILATNLMQNLDEALMRRMSFIVKFPFPNPEDRARIFASLLPAGAPQNENLDFSFLAERVEMSGGHIKNIVIAAAFMAATDREPIGMNHMVRAAMEELKKVGRVPMRGMFAPYCE